MASGFVKLKSLGIGSGCLQIHVGGCSRGAPASQGSFRHQYRVLNGNSTEGEARDVKVFSEIHFI